MRNTTYICDLCGKEIENGNSFTLSSTVLENYSVRYDLCETCFHELGEWLKEKEKARVKE